MTSITYRSAQGTQSITVADGVSVMHAATAAGIAGIVGECGGNAMCATCHVYADPDRLGDLPSISEEEDEMLECTASPRLPNSRLACQLRACAALDGLVVDVPGEQV